MLVFVYGSLKRGFGNHQLLEESEFIGHHITEPLYEMRSLGGYPGVLLNGDTPISGELYRVDEATFQRLDRLEGYPRFYQRLQIPTKEGYAWMYFLANEERYKDDPIVESGVWER